MSPGVQEAENGARCSVNALLTAVVSVCLLFLEAQGPVQDVLMVTRVTSHSGAHF